MKKVLYIVLGFILSCCAQFGSSNVVLKKKTIRISHQELFFRSSGFRYVTIDGEDWWVNRIVVQDSTVDVSRQERIVQQRDDEWSRSCAWLTVVRNGDSLTISVDAEKKMTYGSEQFQIDIQNRDTTVALTGTLGSVLSGGGEDISPSVRSVVFSRNGGKVCIALKEGEVASVIVDGKNPQGWPWSRPNLNNYTCDWLTVHCVPGKTLELTATENPTEEIRTFSLSLAHGNSSAYIRGFQQAAVDVPPADTIGFVPNKVHFPLEGGLVEVVARTDGWVLDEKSYGLDWLTIEQDGSHLRLTATPNFDYDIRRFLLRFKKGKYCEYLEGEQETR